MKLGESTVEEAALEWFAALGHAVAQEPHFVHDDPAL
jgi:hypothetical protein